MARSPGPRGSADGRSADSRQTHFARACDAFVSSCCLVLLFGSQPAPMACLSTPGRTPAESGDSLELQFEESGRPVSCSGRIGQASCGQSVISSRGFRKTCMTAIRTGCFAFDLSERDNTVSSPFNADYRTQQMPPSQRNNRYCYSYRTSMCCRTGCVICLLWPSLATSSPDGGSCSAAAGHKCSTRTARVPCNSLKEHGIGACPPLRWKELRADSQDINGLSYTSIRLSMTDDSTQAEAQKYADEVAERVRSTATSTQHAFDEGISAATGAVKSGAVQAKAQYSRLQELSEAGSILLTACHRNIF